MIRLAQRFFPLPIRSTLQADNTRTVADQITAATHIE
jgi:hypothetical protein